ncbi:MAG: iron chelate uptake ABC transporter family permease subunit [Rhizobiales bacterium]|nr:iron chelate uptake ABC transporter family permease subunit [Hyphomicrobiales bacterium]
MGLGQPEKMPPIMGGTGRVYAVSRLPQKVWLMLATAVLALLVFLSLACGVRPLSLHTVWTIMLGGGAVDERAVVLMLRLPRTLLGLLIGASLGIAGAMIQALTRNPLADPGLLGVNAGASFCILLGSALFEVSAPDGLIWFAFAGACAGACLVHLLGRTGGSSATPVRLVLCGVAVAAVLGGLTSLISLLDPAAFDRFRHWNAGALGSSEMHTVRQSGGFMLAGCVLSLLVSRRLNIVALGDAKAHALGVDIVGTHLLCLVAITLLCGASTAAVGPIGFVGLTVPHVARTLCGPDQRWIVLFCAILGPALLLTADILGRLIAAPAELPAGILCAFVGAPVFIALLRRTIQSRL